MINRQPPRPLLVASMLAALAMGSCSSPPPPPRSGDIIQLEIGDRVLHVEVVFDHLTRKVGLMGRKKLGANRGMLFIFKEPDWLSFWMRNTEIPLSIAFLDDEGQILQIEDMKPKDESSTRSKNKVRYALEVNQGWFQRAGFEVGDTFRNFRERVETYSALAEPRRFRG